MKSNGRPFLCFSVQGGDTQEQNLLQFFLNMVEFGFNVQEACEAANFTSYRMRSSFGQHQVQPGRLTLQEVMERGAQASHSFRVLPRA